MTAAGLSLGPRTLFKELSGSRLRLLLGLALIMGKVVDSLALIMGRVVESLAGTLDDLGLPLGTQIGISWRLLLGLAMGMVVDRLDILVFFTLTKALHVGEMELNRP